MHQEDSPDAEVEGWLKALGVASLCQWDVLVFLYRHQTTLIGADGLARLLGYATEPVVEALDTLEFLDLVERSRVSQGARLYQFHAPSPPPRIEAFERLAALAGHRPGRLRLARQFRRGDRTSENGLGTAGRFPDNAPPVIRAAWQLLQFDEGRKSWLKAI